MMDFRKGASKSKHNEAKRFLKAFAAFANSHQKNELSMAEIYGVADGIELQIEDIQDFVEQLNEAGKTLNHSKRIVSTDYCRKISFGTDCCTTETELLIMFSQSVDHLHCFLLQSSAQCHFTCMAIFPAVGEQSSSSSFICQFNCCHRRKVPKYGLPLSTFSI